MSKTRTKLSIIIVSWNVKKLLRENLKAIFASNQPHPDPLLRRERENTSSPPEGVFNDFEVFVVDNHSEDGTAEMVIKEFPQVNLIMNNYNAGFAKGNNQGIEQAKGEYVLLLNPDMRVFEDTFSNMVEWMDKHPDVGLAGCNLINEEKENILHIRRFPRFWDQLSIILKVPHIFPSILDKYLQKDFNYKKEAEVDSIRGAFFMLRKKVIEELGGLDEQYFIWFEEVDYCRQIKNTKWKLMYTPAAQCIDHVGKSFGQVPRGKTQMYFRDSMLKYFKKWHPRYQYWILKIFWPLGIIISKIKK